MNVTIPQDFIDYRNGQQKLYNARGRSDRKHLMDCDAELHEWFKIGEYGYRASNKMEVDYVDTQMNERIDVKFIPKWFNVAPFKILWMIQQRHEVTHYEFCEWVNKPKRPLEAGDEIEYNVLGKIPYDAVMDGMRMSKDLGYYMGVRQWLN